MKKLYGAALKAHQKKVGRKTSSSKSKSRSTSGGVHHRAYSYKNASGKTVHVAAHVEHPHKGGSSKNRKSSGGKKLFGAALKAHNKKVGRKSKKSSGKRLYGAAALAKKGTLIGAARRAQVRADKHNPFAGSPADL